MVLYFNFNLKDFSKSRTMSSVLVGVERLIVEVRSCYSSHMFLVEGLLWSCRPRTLFVMSNDNEHNKLAEVCLYTIIPRL